MNNIQTTSLDQNFLFDFDDNYQEKSVHLTSNLVLGEFNKITLFFSVDGNSTEEGLNICFTFDNFSVEFTIDTIFQDGMTHNLTETFLSPSEYMGYLDITIHCSGQSEPGSTVHLTILNTTIIEKIEVPSLLNTNEILPILPNWLIFQGSQMSEVERSISSAFYCTKENAELNLTLSFAASDFHSFTKRVKLSINGKLAEEDNFYADTRNEMNIILRPEIGFNILSLNFSVEYTNALIQISTISLSGFLIFFETGADTFDSYQWEENTNFLHSFNISSLKPFNYHSEQVLKVTINYQCHGVRSSTGIGYSLKSGSTVLKQDTITSFEQMYETNTLEILTYTADYLSNIFFTIKGTTKGAGGFIILNTSKVETSPLPKLTGNSLDRTLPSEQTVSTIVYFQTVEFYDVFYISGSPIVNFHFSFNINSSYESPFDYLYVVVENEEKSFISKTIHSVGFTNISVQLPLDLGYHELSISFQIFGLNTPIQIQNIRYQMEIVPEPPTSSLPFGSKAVYWLLGIYAALFFIFVDKNVFRKKIKRESSSQLSVEISPLENQPKKERKQFILTSLYTTAFFCLFFFVSFAFNIHHWGLTILYALCSYYLGKWMSVLDFSWKPFRNVWKEVQDFFSDTDSFTDFFNKIVDLLTTQKKKQILRFLILIGILFTAAVNIGILVFFDQRPYLMDRLPVLKNYYFLFASFILTSLFLFYALHLTKRLSFLEDNFRRTRLYGRLSLTLVVSFLVVLNVLALSKTFDLSTLWTFLSPLMIVGLTKTSNSLGKTIAEEENLTYSKFLKNGRIITKTKEVKQATEQGIFLRKEWKKEKEQLDKNRLRGIIIWDIEPEIPVVLTRLAELIELSAKETEQLLDAIMNETPNLGEYHRKEQVFIRTLPDCTNGTETMQEKKDVPVIEGAKNVIEWKGKIVKGNNRGAGWITLPAEIREAAEPGCFYDLSLIDSKLETHVLIKKLLVMKKSWGFYLPQNLCTEHSLIGETVTCYIYQMDHFPIWINKDKIIRLPNSIVKEYQIEESNLFEVEVITDKGIFGEVILITRVDRSNRSENDEYRLTLRLSDAPRSTEARIKLIKRVEKLPHSIEEENHENFYLPKLFPDGIMGKVHENEMIIFLGNHVPLFTPIRVNLLDFIHYFGCYYADGTKKGWAWRISASTPEQAVYYIEKYNQLICGNQLVFRVSYSKKPSDKRKKEQVKEDLIKYWKEHANVIVDKKITIRNAKHDNVRKWNKCGTLDITDNRNLVMEIHLRILSEVVEVVKHNVNDEYNWQFLFGILEGDGYVAGGKDGFGIGFSTHLSDKVIENALIRLGINYRVDRSRVKDGTYSGITFEFGLFEVLQNLETLSENLFKYYPKRRDRFITRLINQASVEYVLKRKQSLSAPARSSLLAYNLDTDTIRTLLRKLESEISKGDER
ncbi:MAG: hypothetical protein HeimAB125_03260 [Candidatus Heimdallarchaeota archaeon AB_125]|nr:MAG: hypothetical protein HeimAB125_03260 [Candidatus Heimdallarchaeota archaeon AB_125]